jgi:hypothetical protein
VTDAPRNRRRIGGRFAAALGALACAALAAAGHPKNNLIDGAQLSALIRQADRIVVFEQPFDGSRVLFTSRERKDIDELAAALQVAHLTRTITPATAPRS